MAPPVQSAPKEFTSASLQKEAVSAFEKYNRIFGKSVKMPELHFEAMQEGTACVIEDKEKITIRCTRSKSEIAHETAHVWALAMVSETSEAGFKPVSYAVIPQLKALLHFKSPVSMINEGFADYLACICEPELREEILNKLPPNPTDEQIKAMIVLFADTLPEEQKQELLSSPMGHDDLMRVREASKFASLVARDLLYIHEKFGPEKALEIFLGIDENTALNESPENWRAYLKANGLEIT